ncbi:MAG TPA: hypothetical protein VM030_08630 [Acidimicrobiales bacterium]|nr:hypothetical protein [Acidimicrobiales bacterium]
MRRMLVVAVVMTAVVAALGPLPSPAQAKEPLRSGQILTGSEPSTQSWWTTRDMGCQAAADCAAWITSGCDPALVGVNPGVQSSIVDVAELADGKTPRVFDSNAFGATVVQFWDGDWNGSVDLCWEIANTKSSSWHCWQEATPCLWTRWILRVPATAKWMTVTSGQENVSLSWTLR